MMNGSYACVSNKHLTLVSAEIEPPATSEVFPTHSLKTRVPLAIDARRLRHL